MNSYEHFVGAHLHRELGVPVEVLSGPSVPNRVLRVWLHYANGTHLVCVKDWKLTADQVVQKVLEMVEKMRPEVLLW